MNAMSCCKILGLENNGQVKAWSKVP